MFTGFDSTQLFDSHCHLNYGELAENTQEVVENGRQARLAAIIDMSGDLESAERSLALSAEYDIVFAALGIDPQVLVLGGDSYDPRYLEQNHQQNQLERIATLITSNIQPSSPSQVAMIGEIGMDAYWLRNYHHDGKISAVDVETHLKAQEVLFRSHLELAEEFNLPVSVHSRGYECETLDIILGYQVSGILHSFTGDYQTAKKALDSGFALGVNGIITYKSASDLQQTMKKILGKTSDFSPADLYAKGIYLETDAPFLKPSSTNLKTRYNQPSSVVDIFQYITTKL